MELAAIVAIIGWLILLLPLHVQNTGFFPRHDCSLTGVGIQCGVVENSYRWKIRKHVKRRTAIISTYHFIRNNQYADTQNIFRKLLHNDKDLIDKTVEWMIREVGN